MNRTEAVTITNMCMIYDGSRVLVQEGRVYWLELNEMKKAGNLAEGMESTLEIFLREDLSEHFLLKENGEWREVLK